MNRKYTFFAITALAFFLIGLTLLVTPIVSATSLSNIFKTLEINEKNPSDWSLIPDGDCNGLDYNGDHLLTQVDTLFVRKNKIDANKDGEYNSDDVAYMQEKQGMNCKAGKGEINFLTISRFGFITQEKVQVSVWNLEPVTMYQLIYYGDETHNDVWPYATCIGNGIKTSTQGYFMGMSHVFDWMKFINDGVNQKFWVVKSSDVDCTSGMMIAWNPTEYLFEHDVI